MPLDLDALETSFGLVAPRGDRLLDVFYTRLFSASPSVKPLFAASDFDRQKTMLLGALELMPRSLRDPDALIPALRRLGARHVADGADSGHYRVVGRVLIASMAEVAGEAWRPGYDRAWAAALDVVVEAMLDGAASVQLDLAA